MEFFGYENQQVVLDSNDIYILLITIIHIMVVLHMSLDVATNLTLTSVKSVKDCTGKRAVSIFLLYLFVVQTKFMFYMGVLINLMLDT